ncbi:DUF7500 family protein [Halorhabdus amylolytica]|uniref:DUF7500 family protein n=1 Tax=Halorhabdus amylolytica TaxID=2559573 RepID=UPI0010AB362E|nr:hypothetical protein [Halorhabdus amylolytica]
MVTGDDEEDDGRVLAPEELDISDDEHVAEIEDGRYVVSPNDPIGNVDGIDTVDSRSSSPSGTESESSTESESPPERTDPDESDTSLQQANGPGPTRPEELTEADVEDWLREDFREANSRYGFHVTATFDGRVSQRRMMSNDVVTIFESLILWYAQHIDSETPVEEILGILLTESNVPISYPTERLSSLVKAHGLGPEDSIADLLERVDDDGFEL